MGPSTDPGPKNRGTRLGNFGQEENEEASIPEDEPEPEPEESEPALDVPNPLGNYEVIKELGRGGMGAVYLGRQISLNRPVALKVMNPRWGQDPIFVARFTREAYAAAQLTHHNVVQIYDFGEQEGMNFFSMEFVEGKSLGDLVKKEGKIETEEAVGYILQAARGLKYAHDRGMIHRDVKPDNLMLNKHGIVKVADLGLVKTPGSSRADDQLAKRGKLDERQNAILNTEITDAFIAMGSPAYMSPEQCRDAATVDHRADIYSLGCTLYVMLTGRTPFTGKTAMEVMTKHAQEAVIPPESIVQRVPKEISSILLKMMAKDPNDRYADMNGVIKALEEWLGVRSSGPFSPKEEHLTSLEESVNKFNAAPAAKLRNKVAPAFILGSLGLMLIMAFINSALMVGVFSMMVHAVLTYFIINGISSRGYLFSKTKQVVFGAKLTEYIYPAIGVMIFIGVLFITEYIWAWLGFGVLGVGLAFLMHFLVDKKLSGQRQGCLDEVEHMFKRLRLSGLEEENLRLFVAKYSGNKWEEFFESLFGFEEKLKARTAALQGASGKNREKFAAWREPLIKRFDGILKARQEAKERDLLKAVEQKKLEAEGLSKQEAEEQAEAMAEQMVEVAAEIKQAEAARTMAAKIEATMAPGEAISEPAAPVKINLNKMLVATEKPVKRGPKLPINPLKIFMDFVLGWKLRFLLMVVLLAGGFLWLQEKNILAAAERSVDNSKASFALVKLLFNQEQSYPLIRPQILPEFVRGFFDYINPVVAGLLLFISLFFRGDLMSMCFLISAAVICLAHKFGLPDLGPIRAYVGSMIIGAGVAVVGLVVSRKRGH
jgi:serine/threonine protein kinase